MYDLQFSSFLEKSFSPDYVDMINLYRETIYEYGDSSLESMLYLSLPEISDFELAQAKAVFESAIRSKFYHLLEQFGFKTDITELYKLNSLIRAIRALEDSLDHSTIAMICENAILDPMEKVEELLIWVTLNKQIGEILMSVEIEDIGDFISNVHELHSEFIVSQSGEATDERPDKTKIDRIKKYKQLFPETLVTKLLNDGDIVFGIELKELMEIIGEDLTLMMPAYPRIVVENFVGVAILTGIPYYEYNTTLKTLIRKHFTNLRFNQTLCLELDKLMQEKGNEIGQI